MRRWLPLLLLAGCGAADPDLNGPPITPLRMDIMVYPDHVVFYGATPEGPETCSNPFPPPGTTDVTTDGLGCGNAPAQWLAAVELRHDGVTLESETWWPGDWPYLSGSARPVEIALVPIEGDDILIPIPVEIEPVPTIDEVVDDGTTLTVAWSSTPAAPTAIIERSCGFGGDRQHVRAGDPVAFVSMPDCFESYLGVTSLAAPVHLTTEIGDATVWYGDDTWRDLTR